MSTVALIGADGAGKTTIAQRLEREAGPLPIKYIYMGTSLEASNHALPTTRLVRALRHALGRGTRGAGPPDPARAHRRPRGLLGRGLAAGRSLLRLVNLLAEETYRQLLAWYYQRRGYLVLFDRDFYSDYHAHDRASGNGGGSLAGRLHALALSRLYRRPDLFILLDAPAEVLFARKHEGTVDLLEERRQEYLQLRQHVQPFALVDATRPQDDVAQEVLGVITGFVRGHPGARGPERSLAAERR